MHFWPCSKPYGGFTKKTYYGIFDLIFLVSQVLFNSTIVLTLMNVHKVRHHRFEKIFVDPRRFCTKSSTQNCYVHTKCPFNIEILNCKFKQKKWYIIKMFNVYTSSKICHGLLELIQVVHEYVYMHITTKNKSILI